MSKKTHTEYMHAYFAKNVARLYTILPELEGMR